MYDNIYFLVLNSFFLGLAFIGWESRYNIDFYKLKFSVNIKESAKMSAYAKWCLKNGLVKEPISLPEIFLFYLLILPHLNETLSLISIIGVLFLLIIRLCKQQIFWLNVTNR